MSYQAEQDLSDETMTNTLLQQHLCELAPNWYVLAEDGSGTRYPVTGVESTEAPTLLLRLGEPTAKTLSQDDQVKINYRELLAKISERMHPFANASNHALPPDLFNVE